MANKSIEERLAHVEALNLAHGVIIKSLIALVCRDVQRRAKLRDNLCNALEGLYEPPGINANAHVTLQAAIDEVEQLFRGEPLLDE